MFGLSDPMPRYRWVKFTLAVEARMVPFLSRTAVGPRWRFVKEALGRSGCWLPSRQGKHRLPCHLRELRNKLRAVTLYGEGDHERSQVNRKLEPEGQKRAHR